MSIPDAVRAHLESASPDSAVARARAYGTDLSLTIQNLYARTPRERLESLEAGAAFLSSARRKRAAKL
jgi:hypothetical protein